MIKAVVFDMDGLMFDTERVSRKAWRDGADEYGVDFPDDFIASLTGLNFTSIRALCEERFRGSVNIDAFFEIVEKYYISRLEEELPVKPGLFELLDWLREQGYRTAIATSSDTPVARRNLEHAGVTEYFDTMVCGESVKLGKPHPEIYSTAVKLLELSPADCAALDDSPAGILSASGAGLHAIMIPDLVAPTPEIRAAASAVLGSLSEVPGYLLGLGTPRGAV